MNSYKTQSVILFCKRPQIGHTAEFINDLLVEVNGSYSKAVKHGYATGAKSCEVVGLIPAKHWDFSLFISSPNLLLIGG